MVDLLVLCLGWWYVQRIAKEVLYVQIEIATSRRIFPVARKM